MDSGSGRMSHLFRTSEYTYYPIPLGDKETAEIAVTSMILHMHGLAEIETSRRQQTCSERPKWVDFGPGHCQLLADHTGRAVFDALQQNLFAKFDPRRHLAELGDDEDGL